MPSWSKPVMGAGFDHPHAISPELGDKPRWEVADILRLFGQSYAQTHSVSPFEQRVIDDLIACRTVQLGGHIDTCPQCGFERQAYNSCRNRHCPKCQGAASRRSLADRDAALLPVPYVVYSPGPLEDTLGEWEGEPVIDVVCGQTRDVLRRLHQHRAFADQVVAALRAGVERAAGDRHDLAPCLGCEARGDQRAGLGRGLAHQRSCGEPCDGRRLEQGADRQLDPPLTPDPRHQLGGEDRVSSELEEVVVDAQKEAAGRVGRQRLAAADDERRRVGDAADQRTRQFIGQRRCRRAPSG